MEQAAGSGGSVVSTMAEASNTAGKPPAPAANASERAVAAPSPATAKPEALDLPAALRRVEEAARDWGVRPDAMEGRFVSALMSAISQLGRVSEAAQGEFQRLFQKAQAIAEIELERAKEITKASNLSLHQARTAFLGLQVERETTVARMIDETLPMFAERLQGALVIREKLWAEDQRRRRYAMVALVTLGIFLGGYVLRAWQDGGPLDAFGQWCLTHQQQSQGHAFCDVTGFAQSVR